MWQLQGFPLCLKVSNTWAWQLDRQASWWNGVMFGDRATTTAVTSKLGSEIKTKAVMDNLDSCLIIAQLACVTASGL